MRVNQILLYGLLFHLISTTTFAQENKRRVATTRFGFKGGFNRTHIQGKTTSGEKTGYIGGELYFGFFSETTFSPRCKFGQEILFSWTDDYHFIEVPLLVHYRINERWSTFGGVRLDVLTANELDQPVKQFKHMGLSPEVGVQFVFLRRLSAEFRHAACIFPQVTDNLLDINEGRRSTTRLGVGFYFSR
jgi:hypothetical protein